MYTVNFKHMKGEKVFDLVTEQEVTILGNYYCNGKNSFNNRNDFHLLIYFVDSELFCGIREEEQLQKII